MAWHIQHKWVIPASLSYYSGLFTFLLLNLTLGTSARHRVYVSSLKRTWLATFSLTFPLDHFCSPQEKASGQILDPIDRPTDTQVEQRANAKTQAVNTCVCSLL